MDNIKGALDSILDSIEILIEGRLKNIENPFKLGQIKTITGSIYTTTINQEDYDLKAKSGETLAANDIVWVVVPNNNWADAFILCKKPL